MKESAIVLAEEVMFSQEKFREIRSAINDYGHLSEDPELSLYLNEKIPADESLED